MINGIGGFSDYTQMYSMQGQTGRSRSKILSKNWIPMATAIWTRPKSVQWRKNCRR